MKKTVFFILLVLVMTITVSSLTSAQERIRAFRIDSNPIIKPDMLKGDDGQNINGPSMIKVPDWVKAPLGKYYLYFAHHEGKYIRLAYSDKIIGPWKIYEKGTLKMEDCIYNFKSDSLSPFKHIASPDILIDPIKKEIVMYFHCPVYTGSPDSLDNFPQVTLRAISKNGIDFNPKKEILGDYYFRVFKWDNQYYAIARLGVFYRSKDGISNFEKGPNPFLKIQNPSMLRHSAVIVRKNILYVFYSRIGDMPERILLSRIELKDDWNTWTPSQPETVIEPQFGYEGINESLKKSVIGKSKEPVRELRDPAIFEENGKTYLVYSVSGEKGLAIAEIKFEE
jgi:hypothetical protein